MCFYRFNNQDIGPFMEAALKVLFCYYKALEVRFINGEV